MKNIKNRQNGITLVALVITIIILIILAGISIAALTGENGLFGKSNSAATYYDVESARERANIYLTQLVVDYDYEKEVDHHEVGELVEYIDDRLEGGVSLGNDYWMKKTSTTTGSIKSSYKVANLETKVAAVGVTSIEVELWKGKTLETAVSLGAVGTITGNGKIVWNGEAKDKTEIPEDTVAKMNDKYYSTLQAAIDKVGTNNKKTTILLLKDVKENVTIEENKNIILNLDNHELTNANDTAIITLSGTLKIENGTVLGTYTSKVATICVNANSELNISNATIDRSSEKTWETIQLYGNLNIDSGKINSPNSNAICTYANYDTNINISGTAEIVSSGRPAIATKGRLVITGGKITSNNNAINNYGELEISGTAEVSGTGNVPTLYTQSGSKTKVTGGKITSTNSNAINNYGKLEISGTAEVSGTGNVPTLATQSGSKTIISGGTITATNSYSIMTMNGGTTEITGGTISSTESYAIYNKGTTTVSGATISGKTYGI